MLRIGDVYIINISTEKTDHYWLVVTNRCADNNIAFTMLTDARNHPDSETIFAKDTPAWDGYNLKKDTCVAAPRSRIANADEVAKALNVDGKFVGNAFPTFLRQVRQALLDSTATPREVKRAIRHDAD